MGDYFLPAYHDEKNTHTLKGVGGDIIICEEAARMDMMVFFEVVVPLLELDRTCLIAVTTVLDDDNFYSKLLDIKDENGKPLFYYLNFQLGCSRKKCRINPAKCFHNIGFSFPFFFNHILYSERGGMY